MGCALQEILHRRRSKERPEIDRFTPEVAEGVIKKERAAGRELRRSSWWKRKLSHGKCYYCNKSVSPKELTMDHIVPVIRGGKSQKSNIVAACKDCNNRKKHMIPIEWEEYLAGLNELEEE